MKRAATICAALALLVSGPAQAQSGPASTNSASTTSAALPSRSFLVWPTHPGVQMALGRAAPGQAAPLGQALPRQVASQTLGLIQERQISPPRAARLLALTLSAVNDVSRAAQASGRDLNADAAAYLAATRVRQHLYPAQGVSLQDDLQHHLGRLPATTAQASAALAEAVASEIIAFADQDGADRQQSPVAQTGSEAKPGGGGRWQPLKGQVALEPGWGWIEPIALTRQALPKVAPPPAWNSAEFAADRRGFQAAQLGLSAADVQLGQYWAAGPGTVTPGGMWIETALNLAAQHGLDGPQTAALLATTAVAEHNAFISCWQAKFTYNVARPEPWMNTLYPGWTPNIATPPFPSYPSGHATVSGAAARVLMTAFPDQAAQLEQAAQAASHSRVVGGIHWSVDGSGGLDAGHRVALALLGQP